jgi:Skp family chaperone for outer membrane proteins
MKVILIIPFAIILIIASSCNDNKTSPQEEVKITSMDSTTRVLKQNREKLEEQTKKVETSLENLEKEFDSTDTN